MQCPMCGGPLQQVQLDELLCNHGHAPDGEERQPTAAERVTIAFWMAIEALESQAQALRTLGRSIQGNARLADQAENDARTLRELATAQLSRRPIDS